MHRFLRIILAAAVRLIPRRPDFWVFGNVWQRYSDNPKYLFEHLSSTPSAAVRVAWISTSSTVVRELRNAGYEAYLRWSMGGVIACVRAGVYVYNCSAEEINRFLCAGAHRVNLWHGIPVKFIGHTYDARHTPLMQHPKPKNASRFLRYRTSPEYFLVITPFLRNTIFAEAFSVAEEQSVYGGYPRCDPFFWSMDKLSSACASAGYRWLFNRLKNSGSMKIGIWMPSWREDGRDFITELGFDFRVLDRLLNQSGVLLIVKPHPYSVSAIRQHGDSTYGNILFLEEDCDVYPLLALTDFMVTDYSSILFDYLLLNKPLMLVCHDYAILKSQRGTYSQFDYLFELHALKSFHEFKDRITTGHLRVEEWQVSLRSRVWGGLMGPFSKNLALRIKTIVAENR